MPGEAQLLTSAGHPPRACVLPTGEWLLQAEDIDAYVGLFDVKAMHQAPDMVLSDALWGGWPAPSSRFIRCGRFYGHGLRSGFRLGKTVDGHVEWV